MADQGEAAAVGDGAGVATSRRLACLPCSRAKMRCDLNVPCARCFKLCLSCLQVVPKARGPAKGAKGGAAGRSNNNWRTRRKRSADTPALDTTPIVELCIARSDPGVTAGIFLESFYRQLATGRILRDSVVALMRTWRLWNLAAGTDLSWGAFDAMSTALNITPMEVEGPEEVVYDVPHAERQRRAQMFMMGLKSAAGGPLSQVAEGLPYSHSDDLVPTLVTVFKAYPTEGDVGLGQQAQAAQAGGANPSPPWMTAGVAHALSRFRQWSNPACAQMVRGVAEIQGDLLRYRALQFYIIMALFDPEDRAVLSDDYHRTFFTDIRQTTSFVKASLSDGRVRLYIQRCRRVPLSGGRVAILHQIEPCPKSRHLNPKPDVSYSVVRQFRSSKAEGADGDGAYEDEPAPTPAVSAAAKAWAEGQQHVTAGAAAAAAAAKVPAVAVAFPALVGVPAAPTLERAIEQATAQTLDWRAAAAAGVAGEAAGAGGPDIFWVPPASPMIRAPPSPPAQRSHKRGRRPANGGGDDYAPSSFSAPSTVAATASSASGSDSDSTRTYMGMGMGMTAMGGGGPPMQQFQGHAVASDGFLSFPTAAPTPPLPAPPPSPTFYLHPQEGGTPVPVFGGEAELLQMALFGDEDEYDQGGGDIEAMGQGAWEVGGGESQAVGAMGFDPTTTMGVPPPPQPPRPS